MEGRYILNNIVRLLEIMKEADRKRITGVVMCLDFEKCFDMITHQAIEQSLKYFGIGDGFTSWVKLLFQDFELCTQKQWFYLHLANPY